MAEVTVTTEGWIWFSIVICVVLGRFTSQYLNRKKNAGFRRNVQPDDIVMAFATCAYAAVMACLYYYDMIQVFQENDAILGDDSNRWEYIECAVILASETLMQTALWCNKVCLLFIYKRLTHLASNDTLLIASVIFTLSSYVAVITVLFTECRPFSQYFSWEPDDDECLTWWRYNILQLVLNASTDLLLIIMLWLVVIKLNLPRIKRLLLMAIFGLGLFVLAAAVLTKVSVFSSLASQQNWVSWYMREISTAMLVGNLVLCFPLIVIPYRLFVAKIRTLSGSSAESADHSVTRSTTGGSGGLEDRINLQSKSSSAHLRDEYESGKTEDVHG